MSDPRVEAVARIIRQADVLPGNLTPPLDLYIGDAEQALADGDQADREQGIHRVRVDAATVEKVAEVLHYAAGLDDWTASNADERGEALSAARAVLAALTGDES